MSMKDFADHVIAVAQDNHTSISNLKLQKVMYFVLKEAVEKNLLTEEELNDIYDEPFLVWAYGPVVESEYNRFKGFGSSPIIGIFNKDSKFVALYDSIVKFLKESVFYLVQKSHEVEFWKNNKDKIYGFRSKVAYGIGDL